MENYPKGSSPCCFVTTMEANRKIGFNGLNSKMIEFFCIFEL